MSVSGFFFEMTELLHDDHTSAAILRGGSNYRPSGSKWYFPQAKQLDQHNKYQEKQTPPPPNCHTT